MSHRNYLPSPREALRDPHEISRTHGYLVDLDVDLYADVDVVIDADVVAVVCLAGYGLMRPVSIETMRSSRSRASFKFASSKTAIASSASRMAAHSRAEPRAIV